MAIRSETERLMAALKSSISGIVDASEADIERAWNRAWKTLRPIWREAIAELISIADEEEWVTRRKLNRAARVQSALRMTSTQLEELVVLVEERAVAGVPAIMDAVTDALEDVFKSQLPPPDKASITVRWTRPAGAETDHIVRRTATQIHSTLWPLSDEAVEAMKTSLIRGVVVGENPRSAASRMLRKLEGSFNGGRARALNIARTEMLDASRAANQLSQMANTDVVKGWQWLSTLSARTCPSCLSMHGTLHPVDEFGPSDHQSGRCIGVPVLKSWKELGIDLPEPPSTLKSAEGWFNNQPVATQKAILGKKRYAALKRGELRWGDMAKRQTNPGWRDSYVPAKV